VIRRRRRAMRMRRVLRKRRRTLVMRGWNITQGQLYPASTPQVRPLIRGSGAKITLKISMMPMN